jgi:ABC-type sugar transport system ATPase subunit
MEQLPTANRQLPTLELRAISKSFPGVRALDRVSFDIRAGEIHALVGENGAGKSTLMKIVGGAYPFGTYDGEVIVEGDVRRFGGVRAAEDAGIAVVHQELSLIPEFTIAENIFLGREPRRAGIIESEAMVSRAQALLDDLHLRLLPHIPAGFLGIGQQHLVEIAKALARDARILVLDEPTAALTDAEAEVLFGILRRLRDGGAAIVYISHKLGEVLALADRVTVLRDGKAVSTDAAAELDAPRLIARMVGREVSTMFPAARREVGEVVFEARDVTVEDPNVRGKLLVDDVGFSVRRGEVLGVAGLVGAGRSDLLMALFGAHPGRKSGELFVGGVRVRIDSPADAIKAGIGFVTEDRKRFGLFLDHPIVANLTLATMDVAASDRAMKEMRIKAPSVFTLAGTLSGGNQQKIVLAKWLLTNPRVLLLDEPTRGIDVGAKQEIYAQIDRLAAAGIAIVLVSSELPEVLGLADRVIVFREGRICGELTREEATAEKVMACATGEAA